MALAMKPFLFGTCNQRTQPHLPGWGKNGNDGDHSRLELPLAWVGLELVEHKHEPLG